MSTAAYSTPGKCASLYGHVGMACCYKVIPFSIPFCFWQHLTLKAAPARVIMIGSATHAGLVDPTPQLAFNVQFSKPLF